MGIQNKARQRIYSQVLCRRGVWNKGARVRITSRWVVWRWLSWVKCHLNRNKIQLLLGSWVSWICFCVLSMFYSTTSATWKIFFFCFILIHTVFNKYMGDGYLLITDILHVLCIKMAHFYMNLKLVECFLHASNLIFWILRSYCESLTRSITSSLN